MELVASRSTLLTATQNDACSPVNCKHEGRVKGGPKSLSDSESGGSDFLKDTMPFL